MGRRSEISPDTLRIALEPEGIEVEYLDDRSVFYHGVPEKTSGSVLAPPGTEVHVLITDPTEAEGVMIYVDDRKTADEILRNTGVGRVLLETDEERSIFPGVTVQRSGYQVEVASDPSATRGRVFIFSEDERAERSWEIVAENE